MDQLYSPLLIKQEDIIHKRLVPLKRQEQFVPQESLKRYEAPQQQDLLQRQNQDSYVENTIELKTLRRFSQQEDDMESQFTSFMDCDEIPSIQQELQEEIEVEQQNYISFKLDRLQIKTNHMFKQQKKPNSIVIELNLTLILLREIRLNMKVQKALFISGIIDMAVRINSVFFLYQAFQHDPQVYLFALTLLLLPRIIHVLANIKLLFIDLHNKKNHSLIPLAILYQQNFTKKDLLVESKKEWYCWRKIDKNWSGFQKKILILLIPAEVQLLLILLFTRREEIYVTYTINLFILTTIETVCFSPLLIFLVYFDEFALENKLADHGYNEFTLTLIFGSLAKYVLLCSFFLTKRNYQLNSGTHQ